MTVGDMVAYCIRQANKYGISLNREEIIDTLNSQLSIIHFDLGYPKSIWESSISKPSDVDIVEYPPDCIDVQEVYIDGEKAYKLPINQFEEQFKAN
ncbi:MAG: hypothetical protein QXU40_03570 [Candidatus Pacearchaeota archaeon]